MKYSKILASCLFSTVFAFAQYQWDTPDSDASSTGSPSRPSPPASKSSAEPADGKTIFDHLRGHAYNPYSTQGAASTVGDLIVYPSDIFGQKFFYIAPINQVGFTAFGLGEGSALLGLFNSPMGSPAALVFGYATPGFGMALNYSVSKAWESDSETDVSRRITYPGDNIGLYFSLPLDFATLYANFNWLTYAMSQSADYDGAYYKEDYSSILGNIGLNGKSGSFNYDGYLSAIRTGGTRVNDDGDKAIDENTYLGLALGFDLGFTVLQSSTARVIIGLNNAVDVKFYDEVKEPKMKGGNTISWDIFPNILAEVSLFDNWLAFAGAAHSLDLAAGDEATVRNDDVSIISIRHSPGTSTFAGIRYQKTNLAFEAQVSANVFENPFGGFNGNNIFAEFGGFIYF